MMMSRCKGIGISPHNCDHTLPRGNGDVDLRSFSSDRHDQGATSSCAAQSVRCQAAPRANTDHRTAAASRAECFSIRTGLQEFLPTCTRSEMSGRGTPRRSDVRNCLHRQPRKRPPLEHRLQDQCAKLCRDGTVQTLTKTYLGRETAFSLPGMSMY
jgi:hypothetical protein